MQVIKIIEGGIDLRNGQEIPLGIVVTNGIRELMIPVAPETMNALVVMVAEVPKTGLNGEPALEGPGRHVVKAHQENLPAGFLEQSTEAPPPEPPKPKLVQPEPEPEPPMDEDGFEPGEEYNDIGTGASSL